MKATSDLKPDDNSSQPIDQRKKRSVTFKVIIFLILIVAPVLLIMLVFSPLAYQKSKKVLYESYRLPPNYQKKDFVKLVNQMRGDPEFQFYFYALEKRIDPLIDQAWVLMNENRNADGLYEKMKQLMKEVKASGSLFLSLDYPEEFDQRPESYPQLEEIFWRFISQEFKLTILAVAYKTSYTEEFRFQWDRDSMDAAQKLRSLVIKMHSLKQLNQ